MGIHSEKSKDVSWQKLPCCKIASYNNQKKKKNKYVKYIIYFD